jgi:hypothetical protein
MLPTYNSLSQRLHRWRNRRLNRRSRGGDVNGSIRIVFAGDCFGQPLDLEHRRGVPGVCLSGNPAEIGGADAVVFHIPTLPPRLPRKGPGQIWVAWSMESPAHYPQLADPVFMRPFDLTMTYRRDADIPLTYLAGDGAAILDSLRRPSGPKTPGHIAASLVSGRFDGCGRMAWLASLGTRMPVHAYGRQGGRRIPGDTGAETKRKVIATYKFTLAFENAMEADYVTEKFYDPLFSGSVPVYRGAPNIEAFAPGDRCYIDATAFSSAEDLADYLMDLDRDEAAYRRFFEWKTQPLRADFLSHLEGPARRVHPFDRLAGIVAAMKS